MSEYNAKKIKGSSGEWDIVIGLEVHAQVTTNLKLFSNGAADFRKEANQKLDLLDIGLPGTLPVINSMAVDQAIKTGLALNATINKKSIFDRKNYFYPDLPLGYQISQFKDPIVSDGYINIDISDNKTKTIKIERLHLEQDAGKSLHDQHPNKSFIDLNRTGVALMEIVSKPDLSTPVEAATYVKKIRSILRYIGTCDGNMEEGSLRADCNVSVRKLGEKLGTRCEIKNLNSTRFITQAIQYEAERQVEILEDGGKIDQETRLFDTNNGTTRSMRNKEEAHDYRYFPDPDLLPLEVEEKLILEIKDSLPELPDDLLERLVSQYKITPYDASVIVEERDFVDYYEKAAKDRDGKLVANWMITELFGALKKENLSFENNPVQPDSLNELVNLIEKNTISGKIAKEVFSEMIMTSKKPSEIVKQKGLEQVSDDSTIEGFIEEVISQNEDKVNEYRNGKDKLFGFFVGQVMKVSRGKANPGLVNKMLKNKLSG